MCSWHNVVWGHASGWVLLFVLCRQAIKFCYGCCEWSALIRNLACILLLSSYPPLPPLLCPSSLSLILLKELISPSLSQSHPPPLLLLPPLVQSPGPAFSPLEARWPLCSWRHCVWKVWTPAHGRGRMTLCQLVGPRGCYIMARNNPADCSPLRVAPFSIGSHPYSERKELCCILLPLPKYLPLDVSADRTSGRHMHCTWELG